MASKHSIRNASGKRVLIIYRLYNSRYKKWLPDNVQKRHDTKTTYQIEIRYANNTNETFSFHGPPGTVATAIR